MSNEVQVDSAPVDSAAAETKPASGVATQASAEQLDAPAPASDPSKRDKPQDHSSRNRSPRRLKRGARLQFQIVSLVPEGSNVKKGDVLINFDAQKVNQDLQQSQNELEQATKELEKTRVQIDLDESDLAAKLAEAENKYSTLKLKQASIPSLEASI